MSSPFQRAFSAKSPLKNTGHGNSDPNHKHVLDNSDAMKNEYDQTQSDVLNKKTTAYNNYQNQVKTALTDAGYANEEGDITLPESFPQDILDNINTNTSDLEDAYNQSFDSIRNVNDKNSAKNAEIFNLIKNKVKLKNASEDN